VIVRGPPQNPAGPVVAGVDPHAAGAVLEFAFAHAASHQRPLRVVHARPPRRRLNILRVERSLDASSADDAIDIDRTTNGWALRFPTVPVDVRQVHREPTEALGHEAVGASLLVTGTPRHVGPTGDELTGIPVAVLSTKYR
jgi:hypothetical protein